jgi:hypothetical protein
MQARSTTSLLQGGSRQHRTHPCPPGGIGIRQHAALRGARWARAARPRLQPAGALPPPDEPHQQQQQQQQQHQLLQPMIQVPPPDSSSPGGGGERRAMTEPANTSLAPPQDSDTLAAQVEAERGEEERESFITESGLVEEVEEQDAQVRGGVAWGGRARGARVCTRRRPACGFTPGSAHTPPVNSRAGLVCVGHPPQPCDPACSRPCWRACRADTLVADARPHRTAMRAV